MPDTPTSSIAGIHASPIADPGLCCLSDALEPLSPRLPIITKHEVILGTAAPVAVTPSLKGEVAAFEGKDAPRVVGRHRLVDQRCNRQHRQSPAMTLKLMPGLVVLERIPVPVLAIASDGSIFFANTAFAEMVGREPDEVLSLRFRQIFHRVPDSDSLLSVVHALANKVVELAHKDGTIVRALMSRSTLVRTDDQYALAVFHDLTQRFWEEER